MPMPHIGDYVEKKVDHSNYYFMAMLVGVGLFLAILGITKGLTFLISSIIKLARGRIFYFIIGVLILLILVRKFTKKKKKEIPKYEYYER